MKKMSFSYSAILGSCHSLQKGGLLKCFKHFNNHYNARNWKLYLHWEAEHCHSLQARVLLHYSHDHQLTGPEHLNLDSYLDLNGMTCRLDHSILPETDVKYLEVWIKGKPELTCYCCSTSPNLPLTLSIKLFTQRWQWRKTHEWRMYIQYQFSLSLFFFFPLLVWETEAIEHRRTYA